MLQIETRGETERYSNRQ